MVLAYTQILLVHLPLELLELVSWICAAFQILSPVASCYSSCSAQQLFIECPFMCTNHWQRS